MTQSRVSEYDQRILDITKQLCQELNIPNYNPTFVSWEALDSRVRAPVEFRYDDCLIEKYCVTLSAKMKEVLEPEEFRPIIASSLIFSKKLRKRILQRTGIALVGFVVLAVILLYTLPLLFPEPFTTTKSGSTYTGTVGSAFAPITAFTLLVLGTVVVSVVIMRRLRRVADRVAADLVSGTSFLTILNKIAQTMRESGVSTIPHCSVRISTNPRPKCTGANSHTAGHPNENQTSSRLHAKVSRSIECRKNPR